MKATIKLVPEQINELIKADKESLLEAKKKAIDVIEKKFDEDVAKLASKYENVIVSIEAVKSTSKKGKIDVELIKKLLSEGLKVSQIKKQTGYSVITINKYK